MAIKPTAAMACIQTGPWPVLCWGRRAISEDPSSRSSSSSSSSSRLDLRRIELYLPTKLADQESQVAAVERQQMLVRGDQARCTGRDALRAGGDVATGAAPQTPEGLSQVFR